MYRTSQNCGTLSDVIRERDWDGKKYLKKKWLTYFSNLVKDIIHKSSAPRSAMSLKQNKVKEYYAW
jgi:hypothetical protein